MILFKLWKQVCKKNLELTKELNDLRYELNDLRHELNVQKFYSARLQKENNNFLEKQNEEHVKDFFFQVNLGNPFNNISNIPEEHLKEIREREMCERITKHLVKNNCIKLVHHGELYDVYKLSVVI